MRLHFTVHTSSCSALSLLFREFLCVRLQLDCKINEDIGSRDRRRRALLSALREEACAPGASQAPPGREEGEAGGRSEGEGGAVETGGSIPQPKVHCARYM